MIEYHLVLLVRSLTGEDSEPELTQQEQESFVIIDNIKKEERKARAPKIIPSNENMAKLAQTISSFSLRKRKGRLLECEFEFRLNKILGAGASPSTPQRSRVPPSKKNSTCDLPEIVRTEVDTMECEHIFSAIEIFKGENFELSGVKINNSDRQNS